MTKRILVVDDVVDWQKTLSGLLTDEGHDVVAVGDRKSALEAVQASEFDLAVIDVRLDESDEDNIAGLGLAQEVKGVRAELPVIIITGYPSQGTISLARKPDDRGQKLAVDFVLKADVDELVDIVNRRLGSSKS
jgi:DNA-binding NtrC family response regulator